jgi:HlyD family secretion protein
LQVTVDEEGRARVINRYVVAAPVSGQLRRIAWKPGAGVVASETVLAVMETGAAELLDAGRLAQAEARLGGAEAAMAAAQAQAARAAAAESLANVENERIQKLAATGSVSRQESDAAAARATVAAQERRAAEFGRQVAEFERRQAEAVLRRGRGGAGENPTVAVLSPISGRVLRVFQESERVVNVGTPLLEVGDPADLEVTVEVLSRDAVAIRPGARVLLEQWGGASPLEARVRWVEPAGFTKISALGVEEQRVNVICDLVTPAAERATLGDEYRVEARIVVWESPDALIVPAGALFRREGNWRIFVVEGGRARERAVRVGRSNGVFSEVLEGVASGDTVVVYPGDRIRDGIRVQRLDVSPR